MAKEATIRPLKTSIDTEDRMFVCLQVKEIEFTSRGTSSVLHLTYLSLECEYVAINDNDPAVWGAQKGKMYEKVLGYSIMK